MRKILILLFVCNVVALFSNEEYLKEILHNKWTCKVVADDGTSDLNYEMVIRFITGRHKAIIDYHDISGVETYDYNFYINDKEVWIYETDKENPTYIIKKIDNWILESPFAVSFTFGILSKVNDSLKSVDYEKGDTPKLLDIEEDNLSNEGNETD